MANLLLQRERLSISDMFFNHGGVIVGSKWWKSDKEFQEHVHRCAKCFIDVNGLDEITPLMLVDDFLERLQEAFKQDGSSHGAGKWF